jgi:hypothetical protein
MAEVRLESAQDGLYALYVSENVVICDLSKDDAEALLAMFRHENEPRA